MEKQIHMVMVGTNIDIENEHLEKEKEFVLPGSMLDEFLPYESGIMTGGNSPLMCC